MRRTKVAICVPAYNEEKNIGRLLHKLLNQKTKLINITSIVVVTSGCTDRTDELVSKIAGDNKKITHIIEKERRGKSHAINRFLYTAREPIVVVQSADTIPKVRTIENLCRPLVENKKIGMTGGAPIPLNDPNTCLGYIIHAWWWFHRKIPRFGEIIAFRNIIRRIPDTSSVDEAYIQAIMIKKNYNVVHVDEAIVYNKGSENISDLIKQRRRIFNGHSRLFKEQAIKIDNMSKSSLRLMLFEFKMHSLKELVWFMCGILIEIYARSLGMWDMSVKNYNPAVWDIASSTKNINYEEEEDE